MLKGYTIRERLGTPALELTNVTVFFLQILLGQEVSSLLELNEFVFLSLYQLRL